MSCYFRRVWLLVSCISAIGAASAAVADEAAVSFAPITHYREEAIHGLTILVHREVDQHPVAAKRMRAELRRQLAMIEKTLPAEPRAELRKVRIWVEWNAKPRGAAEFHPSRRWLTEHGYNPDKAGHVEISNARNFVTWSQAAQPCMVLHELAHAYHFRVLGAEHPAIDAAYRRAVASGSYDRVAHVDGSQQRAYALTDNKEYFAELSEAYFGKNDFYPFDRAELEQHDPAGFAAVRDAWERPASAAE